eukprot:TRINITY_DN6237_c0_g1_i4.p1 TRINITY_DN6237_c0_g1~~TRINITY_DN6237_c0_g1_i4.p1  ORF type:complete len:245 (-),score=18.56 TRINITY_DN6237_c0_g1_i4:9-743(-)
MSSIPGIIIILCTLVICISCDETCPLIIKRGISKIFTAPKTFEGEGFPVERPIPGDITQEEVDPFLLLDHMGPVNYGPGEAKGAPWHPHRGFETVTYMVQGAFEHQDSMGNKGKLLSGDVQWMTAGSGIIHHEVPEHCFKKKGGVMEGFQLWVNLPSNKKLAQPRYQDIPKDRIATHSEDGFSVRVIAGNNVFGSSSVSTYVPITILDVHLLPNKTFSFSIPKYDIARLLSTVFQDRFIHEIYS